MRTTFSAFGARLALLAAVVLLAVRAAAAEPAIPNFWDEKERFALPDLSSVTRLRFLTTVDFPPMNFLDATGRLTGFHVDLARAICAELGMTDLCQIQALPWEELEAALAGGEGEAVVAGLAISEEARRKYAFSRTYLKFPARFVMRRDSARAEPLHRAVAGERIGVMARSAHERMLRDLFPAARPVIYARQEWLLRDLKEGRLAGVFGDGMRLGFWLAGSNAEDCCRFAGGPYLAPEYLGNGLAIAVGGENRVLAEAFDYALHELNMKGTFAELYLRYFPVSFF